MTWLTWICYNSVITLAWPFIWLVLMVTDGKFRSSWPDRQGSIRRLRAFRKQIGPQKPILWFHAASMGEFEQARPVISAYRQIDREVAIVVTFMSPSGYEARKSYPDANLVIYVPVDLAWIVNRFYQELSPALGIISRYEFWPNLILSARRHTVPLLLINASQKAGHRYGSWYASWFFKPVFRSYTSILTVSDHHTRIYQDFLGLDAPVKTAGDSRYDQVIARTQETDEPIRALKRADRFTLILGSAWPADLAVWVPALQECCRHGSMRLIVVPHEIHPGKSETLGRAFPGKILTTWTGGINPDFDILWVDTMGKLMKLYQLADAAYVGGGFGVHIHNILEPAAWGIPVSHGPVYQKSPEAREMDRLGLTTIIRDTPTAIQWIQKLVTNRDWRLETGRQTRQFVYDYQGSTSRILDAVRSAFPTVNR